MIRTIITQLIKKLKPKTHEEIIRKELLSVKLKKSDIAIDCGANVGAITENLCKSGATVYAFEPNPYAFQVLLKKFSNKPNVHCIQKGVLDCNDNLKLYLHEFSDQDQVFWSDGSSLLDFKKNILKNKYVEVEVIDLSEFIDSLNAKIKLIKMDVEGVECRILKKLINSGQISKIGHIFVETHDHKIPELKAETDEIRAIIKERDIKNVRLDWT
jgi:FkbM family methyltransferase